jgi:polysaccharide biosynthesis/export protein
MKKIIFIIISFSLILCGSLSLSLADDSTYIIGPGDILVVSVWKDENLTRDVVVPPDGVLSFPLVGDIDVNKMTITLLREAVSKRLSEYYEKASVNVMLKQINSLKAYVIGKVNKPGEFSINMDTTVLQLLSMAGGPNPYASEAKINIVRQNGDKTVNMNFNYNEVSKGENLKQNIFLQRGDVIIVP